MVQLAAMTKTQAGESTHLASDIVKEVRREGVSVVPGVFSPSECRKFTDVLDRVVRELVNSKAYYGSSSTQVVYNYFFYDDALYDLFAHPLIDSVMSALIDPDYVLISPSARNPYINKDLPGGGQTSGSGWHVDSRVANPETGDLFRPSLSYYAAIALEPFERDNSATNYVPRSHLLYKKPQDRNANLDFEILEAKAGSMLFFDSALWHRTGIPTDRSRWSIFNMYGPWHMKPYFRFAENFSRDKIQSLPVHVQKLLHLCSVPPKHANGRTTTVTKTPTHD